MAARMIEHCLYGVKVICDFALFDRPTPVSAVAPGEHSALELRQAGAGRATAPGVPGREHAPV